MILQLRIGEKAYANVIKTGMVGKGEMVVFLGSYLISLIGIRILRVSFSEFNE